jgi:hypothetical protein
MATRRGFASCSTTSYSPNALKYAPEGSHVELAASRPEAKARERFIRITVCDGGPGVPAKFRERIFDKFFRVEHHQPGADEGTRGVGIGLYLCRQIVALHGVRSVAMAAQVGSEPRSPSSCRSTVRRRRHDSCTLVAQWSLLVSASLVAYSHPSSRAGGDYDCGGGYAVTRRG